MPPLQVVHCFGDTELTIAPAQARNLGAENPSGPGGPEWLATGTGLVVEWLPDRREMGGVPVYIDPASGLVLDERAWVEVTGHYDHPAARLCTTGVAIDEEFQFANDAEAVNVCRGRFVVTGVRRLAEAEIPPAPPVPTPGAAPAATVPVEIRLMDAPIRDRVAASAVWTGSEMIAWGGWVWDEEDGITDARSGGAAYNPSTGTWREIATGPLAPRANHLAVWTGTEMLVWGGYRDVYVIDREIAAYDPSGDNWRSLERSPIDWTFGTKGVWTGTEWVIASYSKEKAIQVVAYGPASDAWRRLPPPPTTEAWFDLVWTGSEVLLVADRVYRTHPRALRIRHVGTSSGLGSTHQ
jgi:hypothetical protein